MPPSCSLALLLVWAGSLAPAAAQGLPYQDPRLPVERRVEDLLGRMTLAEKVGQLNMPCGFVSELGRTAAQKRDGPRKFTLGTFVEGLGPGGGLFTAAHYMGREGPRQQALFFNELQRLAREKTRLGIPLLQNEEGTHGVMAAGHTVFPEGPTIGSTWDMALVREIYAAAAREARSVGIHQLFTLVVEPIRDPRLGRNIEAYSEDPWLTSRIAEAIVTGAQGSDVSAPDRVVAGLCHYPGQSAAVGGLERGAMAISERALRETFLPPWVAGIRKKGALGVMATYPAIDGIPVHASEKILTKILREELGFEGLVLSEGLGILTLIEERVAANQKEAGQISLRAGVDVSITHEDGFMIPLMESVKEGSIPEALVDRAVRRILRQKFRLGLFDRSFVDPDKAAATVHSAEHQRLALRAAREGIVLLKNEKNVLPLAKGIRRLAVIGPNADHVRNQLGDYTSSVVLQPVVTVLEGIRRMVSPQTEVRYAKGCKVLGEDRSGFAEAVAAAKGSDAAIVVVGENERWSREGGTNGEEKDVASLDLSGAQEDLIRAVHETGVPTVVVLINGRPLSIRWTAEHVPGIVEAWQPGEAGGTAVAEVLFGDVNPSGRLPITFPRHVGQLPLLAQFSPTRGRWVEGRLQMRDYVDMKGSPLYPFGHGLSYTSFEYSNLKIEPREIGPGGGVAVSVEVKNTGARAGDEVVQLYLTDVVASVVRPAQELRGFERVSLAPGQTKTVRFRLEAEDLSLLDRNLEPVVEPGAFEVRVGRSSEDIRLQGSFAVRASGIVKGAEAPGASGATR